MSVLQRLVLIGFLLVSFYPQFGYATQPVVEKAGITVCQTNEDGKVECRLLNFTLMQNEDGSLILCRLFSNGRCEILPGNVTINDTQGVADYKHDLGPEVNGQLANFLWQYLAQELSMRCDLKAECDIAKSCGVKISCN